MSGIFQLDFGPGSISDGDGTVRRVRHGDMTIRLDGADDVTVLVNLSRSQRVAGHVDGGFVSNVPRIGSITVEPPGCRVRLDVTGRCVVLLARVGWRRIAEAAAGAGIDPAHFALPSAVNADDPSVARQVFALAAAEDDLAREEALAAVAGGLVQAAIPTRRRPVGLPARALRRALEMIHAEPAPSLATLAGEAGISPFHFARGFRTATGLAPHEYVLRCRVERSMDMLAKTDLPIETVARAAGFAHASHQARRMRVLLGVSPQTYRKRILPASW